MVCVRVAPCKGITQMRDLYTINTRRQKTGEATRLLLSFSISVGNQHLIYHRETDTFPESLEIFWCAEALPL